MKLCCSKLNIFIAILKSYFLHGTRSFGVLPAAQSVPLTLFGACFHHDDAYQTDWKQDFQGLQAWDEDEGPGVEENPGCGH